MAESAITRNIESLIMRRFAELPQKVVADALKCDVSKISKFVNGTATIQISEIAPLLAVLGLWVTEVGHEPVTLPAEEIRALKVLARKGLRFED